MTSPTVPAGVVPRTTAEILFRTYDGRGVPGNLEANDRVDVRLRDGTAFHVRIASELRWEWSPSGTAPGDIVAWRRTPYERPNLPDEMHPAITGGEPIPLAQPRKHSHYFKPVVGLAHIDVYRVLELFNVTDQALGHAIKKLLVAGGRGAGKDIRKDVQEAVDTLQRRIEMWDERTR